MSYLTSDHLGSPRIITDQTGQVTNRKDYMAFGEETQTTQRTTALKYENQTETRKGYTGYEKDLESGLDFAQARYYNSSHGRYTSVDPLTASANLKNPQTFNRYSYVLNSPYKYTDPLGLVSTGTGACGDGCASDRGARGERGYNRDLADFLSRNMVRASFGHQATYEPETNSVIANTSDAGSGNSHGNGGRNSQVAVPPSPPPSPTAQNAEKQDEYIYARVNVVVGEGRVIEEKLYTTDEKGKVVPAYGTDEFGNKYQLTQKLTIYTVTFELVSMDGSPLPEYSYDIGQVTRFGVLDYYSNQPITLRMKEGDSYTTDWQVTGRTKDTTFTVNFQTVEEKGNVFINGLNPINVPVAIRKTTTPSLSNSTSGFDRYRCGFDRFFTKKGIE